MKKIGIIIVLILTVPIFTGAICFADTAQVLPKGRIMIDAVYYYYSDIEERYDQDGDPEPLANDINGELDSTVFSQLTALEPFIPGGYATLGRSVIDATLIARNLDFSFGYGLSDKVSIGILVPYFDFKVDVDASLDTNTATVGKSVLANSLAPLTGPAAPPDVVPLATDDIQDLIGPGMDINGDGTVDLDPGLRFNRLEDWSDTGIGDIEIAAKYKFYDQKKWRLAAAGGLRLPTGELEDEDTLQDWSFGSGQTDILLQFYADYITSEKLLFNGRLEYSIQLPDEEVRRVPDSVDSPVSANKEKVDRDLGDIIDLELTGYYSFSDVWSAELTYNYTTKFKDSIDGDQGFAYSSLEKETDWESHMAIAGLRYSTVKRFLKNEASIPYSLGLLYRNRFAGDNNVTESEYVALNLTLFL